MEKSKDDKNSTIINLPPRLLELTMKKLIENFCHFCINNALLYKHTLLIQKVPKIGQSGYVTLNRKKKITNDEGEL